MDLVFDLTMFLWLEYPFSFSFPFFVFLFQPLISVVISSTCAVPCDLFLFNNDFLMCFMSYASSRCIQHEFMA